MRISICAIFALFLSSATASSQALFDFPPDFLADASNDPAIAVARGGDRTSAVNFTLTATVLAMEDGDTITLEGSNKARFIIRFSDIDTPEVAHKAFTPRDCQCKPIPFRPGQPGGKSAKQSLEGLVAVGDKVAAECYEMDQYGRAVCHIFKAGLNLNLEQIKRGWGWLPSKAEWVRDPQSRPAEDAARKAKLGAWALQNQVPPAEWRKNCWIDGKCDGAEN
ncbi:thermonuclease family protein [Bradyrhizobium sp. USDA 3458]|uniref:thermonuclease family protein n=1 Tax=Bradyrhizobium sp. USDA 3458 TaxID=2591461 RepID=UPI00114436C3|nr:thermonuclease family protein [Bradyrhizobium sp. USDA 3458]